MSVAVIAAEHALRLTADENKVFYVLKQNEKVKFPYSGTAKIVCNGQMRYRSYPNDIEDVSVTLKVLNSKGKICADYMVELEDSDTTITREISFYAYFNVDKNETYYYSFSITGRTPSMSRFDTANIYATTVYGNKLVETVG